MLNSEKVHNTTTGAETTSAAAPYAASSSRASPAHAVVPHGWQGKIV
jgi:hypothetical protein